MQTVELLRLSQGTVTALDLLPQMIARITETVAQEGFADRVEMIQADMNDMAFEPGSFDIIWLYRDVDCNRGLAYVRPRSRF